jgi:spore germination protein YaaH
VMASPDLRDEQMNAILKMAEDGHFDGVDIDYGALDPLRKDDFSEFVTNLADQLHRRNLKLTLTAPLPVQQGTEWDTGAYDWTRLSQAGDFIKVVPEEDPSRYYRRTEPALTYLIEDAKIAPAKLVLVVSALGREKGGEGIRSVTALEALSLASTLTAKNGTEVRPGDSVVISGENIDTGGGASGIGWDDEASAVSFTYPGLGGARQVWIENAFSVGFQLDLAARYHLGGVAIDDVSTGAGAADIWPVVQDFIDSGNVSLVKPNGTLFVPHWEADGGSLEGGDDGSVTWTAPADAGTYAVTLIVSDGIARVGQRLSLTVKP